MRNAMRLFDNRATGHAAQAPAQPVMPAVL
jgi:hypothetical protein